MFPILALALGCRPPATIRQAFQAPSPHEQYAASLSDAGLGETGLGRSWVEASRRALLAPIKVTLPFREAAYFSPAEAAAVGYQFELRRGQQFSLECVVEGGEPFAVFLDLFEPGEEPKRVASASTDERRLEFEAERDGSYILRVQPELLRGGRVVVTQRVSASLAFPVPAAVGRVHSVFGDPRDSGVRNHEGIDIFAARGTPAVAAVDGIVRHVGTNNLGGNVVWIWDTKRDLSYYYAHLDRPTVRAGQRVKVGETVGHIGNTGNARATAPHLHFGIYAVTAGALDPLPFVVSPPGEPAALPGDLAMLGKRRRASRNVRLTSAGGADPARALPRHTVFFVDAAVGNRLRVRLPDGTLGFVARADTEAVATAVRRFTPRESRPLLDRPAEDGVVVQALAPGAPVPVFGVFSGYLFVRVPPGREGWIPGP